MEGILCQSHFFNLAQWSLVTLHTENELVTVLLAEDEGLDYCVSTKINIRKKHHIQGDQLQSSSVIPNRCVTWEINHISLSQSNHCYLL